MRKLSLDELKQGRIGVTKAYGTFLSEAAMFCLEENGHDGQVQLEVLGDFQETFELVWTDKVTKEVRDTWTDEKEATEYAATAIALLIIPMLTDFNVFKRTRGGTDYILGKSTVLKAAQGKHISYLEISGIWKESNNNTVNMRVKLKDKQVKKTVINAPALVVVTEFHTPKTKIKQL